MDRFNLSNKLEDPNTKIKDVTVMTTDLSDGTDRKLTRNQKRKHDEINHVQKVSVLNLRSSVKMYFVCYMYEYYGLLAVSTDSMLVSHCNHGFSLPLQLFLLKKSYKATIVWRLSANRCYCRKLVFKTKL